MSNKNSLKEIENQITISTLFLATLIAASFFAMLWCFEMQNRAIYWQQTEKLINRSFK